MEQENNQQPEAQTQTTVFDVKQFSTKLSDQELAFLNARIALLRPQGFEGTKTDAFKLIIADMQGKDSTIEEQRSMIKETQEELHQANLKIDQLIEALEKPVNAVEFPESMIRELSIIAFLAHETKFIEESRIDLLVYRILKHYQSQGFFLPTPEEIRHAEQALNLQTWNRLH